MKFLFSLLVLGLSLSAWTKPMTHHEYLTLTIDQKVKVLEAYKDFLRNMDQSDLADLQARGLRLPSLIDEAYASLPYECLYAGWPSIKVRGKCTHPMRGNTHYTNGNCSEGQLQCQPTVFGADLCVDISTQAQRNRAFSQCENKFRESNRSLEEIARGLDLRSTTVNDLFAAVEHVCRTKGGSICSSLNEKISAIRGTTPAQQGAQTHEEGHEEDHTGHNHGPQVRAESPQRLQQGPSSQPLPPQGRGETPEQALRRSAEAAARLNNVVQSAGTQEVCTDRRHTHARPGQPLHGVTLDDFKEAPCKTSAAPTSEVIAAYVQNYRGNKKSENKFGVNFVNESEDVIQAFRELVAGRDMNGQYDLRSCSTALCAVSKIWGADLGPKLLYMRLKHRFNGSEFAYSESRRFQAFELDFVLLTLDDMPTHLQPLGRPGQQLTAMVPNAKKPTPEAAADSSIKLYQPWLSQLGNPQFNRMAKHTMLMHELGHVRGFERATESGGHQDPAFLALPACQVSVYGNTNRVEDYAESFVTYRYNGRALKRACPQKYAFMKDKVYAGIEYLDENTCRRDPAWQRVPLAEAASTRREGRRGPARQPRQADGQEQPRRRGLKIFGLRIF